MKQKVAIYCRVSTEKQEERNLLELQIKQCKDEVERNENYELLEVLSDVTNETEDARLNFDKLLEMIKSKDKKPDVILVTDFTRISRKPEKFEEFMELCNNNNVMFKSLTK